MFYLQFKETFAPFRLNNELDPNEYPCLSLEHNQNSRILLSESTVPV